MPQRVESMALKTAGRWNSSSGESDTTELFDPGRNQTGISNTTELPMETEPPFLVTVPFNGFSFGSNDTSLEVGADHGTLNYLTDDSLISRGPLVFVLVLMIIVGSVVNTLVTVVFMKRFPASALRSYIVTMSVSDMLATMVGIPLYIFTIINAYNFMHSSLCQLAFFFVSWPTNSSSFVIVVFAMDRLRRVHRPSFKETDKYKSYYHVGIIVFLATAVTVPFVPMFGIYTQPTFSGVAVRICWVDDKYKGGMYPLVYNAVLTVTFVVSLVLIAVSYGIIGYRINALTSGIIDDVICKLENPPPPNKYMYIYYDDEPSPQKSPKVSEVKAPDTIAPHLRVISPAGREQMIPESDKEIGFAERLASPRPGTNAANAATAPEERKTSRIKKLSNAIQNLFAVPGESDSESSSSPNSFFISQRACPTFGKSLETKTSVKSHPVHRMHLTAPRLSPQTVSGASGTLAEINSVSDIDSLLTSTDTFRTSDSLGTTSDTRNYNVNLSAKKAPKETAKQSPPASKQQAAVKTTTADGNPKKPGDVADPHGPQKGDISTPVSPETSEVLTPAVPTTEPKAAPPATPQAPETASEASSINSMVTEKQVSTNEAIEGHVAAQAAAEACKAQIAAMQEQQMKEEALITLQQLEHLRLSSRNTMVALTLIFILTWLPNAVARVISPEPAQLCEDLRECWGNMSAYAVSSVFVNSTINAFFYCFSSVHFRRQVKLFFKPCKERLCRKRRKKKVRILRKKRNVDAAGKVPKPPAVQVQPPLQEEQNDVDAQSEPV